MGTGGVSSRRKGCVPCRWCTCQQGGSMLTGSGRGRHGVHPPPFTVEEPLLGESSPPVIVIERDRDVERVYAQQLQCVYNQRAKPRATHLRRPKPRCNPTSMLITRQALRYPQVCRAASWGKVGCDLRGPLVKGCQVEQLKLLLRPFKWISLSLIDVL